MALTYTITLEAPDADPVFEAGEARDPVRDVRRLLDAFLTKQAMPAGGLSTHTPPAFSRLMITFTSEPE